MNKVDRQLMIESHGITVIRTNPKAKNCTNRLRNQIYIHIIKSIKKQPKKSLIDHLMNFSARI